MNDMTFELTNDNGETITCEALYTFINNGNNYMLYTDNELDENGDIEVLATKYTIDNDKINLIEIETDEEWDLVDKEWSNAYNEK